MVNNSYYNDPTYAQYRKTLSSISYDRLSAKQERELVLKAYRGCKKSFDILVKCSLRFVVYVIRDFKIPNTVNIMDVIQEGNLGLMTGIAKFNPEKYNNRLSTYCVLWIKFFMTKFLKKQYATKTFFTSFSIDKFISDDSLEEYGVASMPLIEKEAAVVSIEVQRNICDDIISYAFTNLEERERSILVLYFGLQPPTPPKTLQEIGLMLHLNFERIRQIRDMALDKLNKDKVYNIVFS